ncbi:HAD family phosphatase [Isoptericola halotolerans]
MDGTLVDTEPYWIAAEHELVAEHGGTWTHAQALQLVGNPLEVSAGVLQEAGVDLPVPEIVSWLLTRVTAQVHDGVPWQLGARELLASLADAGVPCALVTMSYAVLAEAVTAHVPGAFATLVTGDQVTRGKPDPEPYLVAARRLGVRVEDCVAIEDSPAGIGSALAAGARTLGVEAVLPVEPRDGLSRAASLADIDLAVVRRLAAGEVLELV